MIAPAISAFSGSSADRSLPRRSAPARSALSSHAPERSRSRRVAPEHLANMRSASRILVPTIDAELRSAPGSPTKDQSPPSIFAMSHLQPSNILPMVLQRMNSTSKKLHRVKVQLTNAVSKCLDTLNLTLRNVHSVNAAPLFSSSVKSQSVKSTLSNWSACVSVRPYQSAPRTVDVVGGASVPLRRSAITLHTIVRSD